MAQEPVRLWPRVATSTTHAVGSTIPPMLCEVRRQRYREARDECLHGRADAGRGRRSGDVVKKVRWALTAANIRAHKEGGLGFDLDSIVLKLSVVQTYSAEGGFKLKIPWTDSELGFGGKISKAQTQVIAVEVGVPETDEAEIEQQSPPIDVALQDALLQVASMVRSVESADRELSLRAASVQMQLALSRAGEISIVPFKGSREDVTTHSLTVGVKQEARRLGDRVHGRLAGGPHRCGPR